MPLDPNLQQAEDRILGLLGADLTRIGTMESTGNDSPFLELTHLMVGGFWKASIREAVERGEIKRIILPKGEESGFQYELTQRNLVIRKKDKFLRTITWWLHRANDRGQVCRAMEGVWEWQEKQQREEGGDKKKRKEKFLQKVFEVISADKLFFVRPPIADANVRHVLSWLWTIYDAELFEALHGEDGWKVLGLKEDTTVN